MPKCGLLFISLFVLVCSRQPQNAATFCRDFNIDGCIGPEKTTLVFSLEKSERKKTFRDFWNSVYFRGDRVAFAVTNAYARVPVTFECLHGYYFFPESPAGIRPSVPTTESHDGSGAAAGTRPSVPTTEKPELEYIELREKDVYGLVMLGAMLERRFPERRNALYTPPPPFMVTYHVSCGKDLLMQSSVRIEMK